MMDGRDGHHGYAAKSKGRFNQTSDEEKFRKSTELLHRERPC